MTTRNGRRAEALERFPMEGLEKEVYTTGEIAKFLKTTTNTVVKWFDEGHLSGYTFPGTRTRRILKDSFLEFCEKNDIPFERMQREIYLTTGQVARVSHNLPG